eukprot:TRINITY_DN12561_c0_g2_i10.p2 TRINITY_DN12561_c0_g2~~TRINITY_DN12561_c0_g2_i10.p2  ORF type:complete len:333 (+),score=23.60 TRINITY_DN12561_c0_g2_i10:1573-2571(+)
MAKSNSIDTSAGDVSEQIKAVASKCKWTGAQLDLFSKATDILLELRHHETVIRGAELQLHGLNVTGFDPLSAYVATSTSKLRELFADILWDKDQVLWLLKTIYDHHDEPHRQLCSRLLQRLHHKVPALVKATGLLEAPEFSIELRSWIASEPLKINWGQNESKPADALLVCLPCEWSWSSPMLKAWTELLGKKWTVGMQSEAPEGLDDLEETSELLVSLMLVVTLRVRVIPVDLPRQFQLARVAKCSLSALFSCKHVLASAAKGRATPPWARSGPGHLWRRRKGWLNNGPEVCLRSVPAEPSAFHRCKRPIRCIDSRQLQELACAEHCCAWQ